MDFSTGVWISHFEPWRAHTERLTHFLTQPHTYLHSSIIRNTAVGHSRKGLKAEADFFSWHSIWISNTQCRFVKYVHHDRAKLRRSDDSAFSLWAHASDHPLSGSQSWRLTWLSNIHLILAHHTHTHQKHSCRRGKRNHRPALLLLIFLFIWTL